MTTNWQIKDFLIHRDGRLHIEGVDAVELAREQGTPLFVFSESRIRHNIDRLKKAGEVIDCPLKLCYAAKAMSTMGILKVVKDAGCDIEVNSGGELWKALKAGFTGEQINFNGNSKEIWELELAIENGIYAIQVDSLYELELIEDTARRLEKKANVSLRLVPEIESGTHSGLQTALVTSKFGMMPNEAMAAFREYKDSPHLSLNGIHLHIGSQNPDPAVYTEALVLLFDYLVRIYSETGLRLGHINLGGGFPVDYLSARGQPAIPGEKRQFVDEAKRNLSEALDRGYFENEFPDGSIRRSPVPEHIKEAAARETMFSAGYDPDSALRNAWSRLSDNAAAAGRTHLLENLTILLEPGRSIISDAGVCLTSVRNIKKRPLSDIDRARSEIDMKKMEADAEQKKALGGGVYFRVYDVKRSFGNPSIAAEHWLLTDAGFNILLSMETYKWYYHLISAERADEEHNFPYKVAGPLCDGGDVYFDIEGEGRLPDHRMLPQDVRPGEVLALLNTGAYTLSQASQYNARFLPAVLLIRRNGEVDLIRERDGFDDLINKDVY